MRLLQGFCEPGPDGRHAAHASPSSCRTSNATSSQLSNRREKGLIRFGACSASPNTGDHAAAARSRRAIRRRCLWELPGNLVRRSCRSNRVLPLSWGPCANSCAMLPTLSPSKGWLRHSIAAQAGDWQVISHRAHERLQWKQVHTAIDLCWSVCVAVSCRDGSTAHPCTLHPTCMTTQMQRMHHRLHRPHAWK